MTPSRAPSRAPSGTWVAVDVTPDEDPAAPLVSCLTIHGGHSDLAGAVRCARSRCVRGPRPRVWVALSIDEYTRAQPASPSSYPSRQ